MMDVSAQSKHPIDWELVERYYRAGVLTNVQIATECGLTEGAIRKRAKRDGWTKDLSAKIKARAEELVRRQEVRDSVRASDQESEKQTIEVNAQAAAMVLLVQKGSIKRMHSLFSSLMSEVEAETGNAELFGQLGELLAGGSGDDDGRAVNDKLSQIYQKVISSPGRVDSTKKLAEILEKIVRLEREAFGLNNEERSANSVDDLLAKINAAN